jgi:hypothetical protein
MSIIAILPDESYREELSLMQLNDEFVNQIKILVRIIKGGKVAHFTLKNIFLSLAHLGSTVRIDVYGLELGMSLDDQPKLIAYVPLLGETLVLNSPSDLLSLESVVETEVHKEQLAIYRAKLEKHPYARFLPKLIDIAQRLLSQDKPSLRISGIMIKGWLQGMENFEPWSQRSESAMIVTLAKLEEECELEAKEILEKLWKAYRQYWERVNQNEQVKNKHIIDKRLLN